MSREFTSAARWDLKENKQNGELEKVTVKTVAGFLNTDGGNLLIGVTDDGAVIGLTTREAIEYVRSRWSDAPKGRQQ